MSNYDDKAEVTRDFYRKQGAEAERARIIKILEEESAKFLEWNWFSENQALDDAINIVKREQK